jgi:hypothetical protein
MTSRPLFAISLAVQILGNLHLEAYGQISSFPYAQNFDSVALPALPSGWASTRNISSPLNDFTTTNSIPHSPPHAVISTNATIAQELVSPLFDFAGSLPDSISFYTRRSGSHIAPVVVEASLDSGRTYNVQVGDTLTNPGSTAYVHSILNLPSLLASSRGVMFRLRVIPAISGSSGTFRIDNIRITAQTMHDLALTGIRFVPVRPVEGDSVEVAAMVRNVAVQVAQQFSVDFYVDVNNDSIPQVSELVVSGMNTSPLAVSDSVDLSSPLGVFSAGEQPVIAKVVYVLDQNPSNDQAYRRLVIGYPSHTVVINEIMYAPTGIEPEWVELYNTKADSINLKDWLVSDSNIGTKRLLTSLDIMIPPTGYVILTRDSADLLDNHPMIQSRVINVAGFPTLNNTGDAVVVYDNRIATMDSVSCVPVWGGNTGGRSLERVDPLGPSTLQPNWGTSRNPSGSTPGARNSLTRKDHDLELDSLFALPVFPVVSDSLVLFAQVSNTGTMQADSFDVFFYEDANSDSLPQQQELLTMISGPYPLGTLDSLQVMHTLAAPSAGVHAFIASVKYVQDEDTTNNIGFRQASVGFPAGTVRINEIMYAPPAGIPEWVELLNVSSDTIDLRDWRIGNRTMSSRYPISSESQLVQPSGFVVVTKDSALMRQAYPFMTIRIVQSSLPTFLWNNSVADSEATKRNQVKVSASVISTSTNLFLQMV